VKLIKFVIFEGEFLVLGGNGGILLSDGVLLRLDVSVLILGDITLL